MTRGVTLIAFRNFATWEWAWSQKPNRVAKCGDLQIVLVRFFKGEA